MGVRRNEKRKLRKGAEGFVFSGVEVDHRASTPIHRQLYNGLREAILTRRLRSGMRLPSSRALAESLEVARNTVLAAFEQLEAEGYLESRIGSGTFVAPLLPEDFSSVKLYPRHVSRVSSSGRKISDRGAELAGLPTGVFPRMYKAAAFIPGLPAADSFPIEAWGRLASKRWRTIGRNQMGYGHPAGYQPLREAVAAYLGRARGVGCDTEQVIIIAGSQQGLDLTARVLLDPGDAVWMEDPGYRGARGALTAAGARVVPVPVDDQGLDAGAGQRREPDARMVYVTPSHQFPLGVVMTVSRRLELLQWSARRGAWILEDDYDSEYRYKARPLAALQGLDTERRVIYIGTFSKVLFPSLRLGYLIVPVDLIDAFTAVLAHTSGQAPLFEQMVLADFMDEGHFERHIRRMRGLYKERQRALVDAAERDLSGILEVAADEAGMHLIGWLPRGVSDRAASRAAVAEGVYAPPLSFYCLKERHRGGLLLGYACIDESEIYSGVRRLAKALKRISVT